MSRIKARVIKLERRHAEQQQEATEAEKREAIAAAMDCLELALGRKCFAASPLVSPAGELVYGANGGHLWAHSPAYHLWERVTAGEATPADNSLLGAVHEHLSPAGLSPVDFLALLVADEIHAPEQFSTAEQQPPTVSQQQPTAASFKE